MQLSAGDKLGPYEIAALIGKGGMGEVYRASDTRLGRTVAIKVSAREFSDRFEREARAISSLNHPNICTLYDIGPNYLVMEFVEGDTLSKLIDQGPLPLDRALQYAVQITDALAAAHAKGVIHRDLKPGNIIVTRNGVKVLDFGLAKLSSDKPASSSGSTDVATMTEPITGAGAILGTLHYMSPEQVEGKDTDQRSDIFALGVVLYEMITGRRAFTGDTQAAILAAILKDQPAPMHERQPQVPRSLERVVRKCMEKKPDDRWQSARDLKPTLELIDLDAPTSASISSSQPIVPPPSRRRWLWPSIAAVALLAIAGAAYTFWPKSEPPARVTRFEVALPPDVQLNPTEFYVRISPDGTKLAFVSSGGKAGIWIRDLESVQARVLAGTEGAVAPFWSPDSKSLAYAAGNRLMRVDVAGGPPQVLCESKSLVGSGFWTKDGEIVFGPRGAGTLQKVSAAGGVPTPVVALVEGEATAALPSLLPDGRQFLYLLAGPAKRGIFAGSLDNKPDQQPRKQVAPAQFGVTFAQAGNAAGGVMFFVRDGTLMAQPFDPKALKLMSDPVPVVQQIGTGPQHAHFSVTSTGVMAYRTGVGNNVQLAWLDRKGSASQKIGEPGKIGSLSLSPDESQIALFRSDTNVVLSGVAVSGDIWLLDLRNIEARLTTGQGVQVPVGDGPVWSPDSKQLAYASGTKLYMKDVSGASDAKLVKDVGQAAAVTDWTRDGKFMVYTTNGAGGGDIFAISAQGGVPAPVVATEAGEALGRVSPDGRWIAYQSNRSGRTEVYVRPFTAPGSGSAPSGPVIQISADGGTSPKWRADGKELFFNTNGPLMAADIETSNGAFRPAAPVALGIRLAAPGGWSPDRTGQKFLLAPPLDQGAQTPITVVTNWEATLRR